MITPKSPFFVMQDLLSPKVCEQIIDKVGFYAPDHDENDNPIAMSKTHESSQELVYYPFMETVSSLEEYYGFKHNGTETMQFEFMAEGVEPIPHCENSKYIEKKWARVYNRDFTCVVFLSDYNDEPPFDSDFEVYGGKLEFPQHKFGFNPKRGTMIAYPSGPHFINASSTPIVGDLFQVRFHIACALPFLYQPTDFPGNYLSWFGDL